MVLLIGAAKRYGGMEVSGEHFFKVMPHLQVTISHCCLWVQDCVPLASKTVWQLLTRTHTIQSYMEQQYLIYFKVFLITTKTIRVIASTL